MAIDASGNPIPDQGQGAGSLTLPQDPVQLAGQIRDQQNQQMANTPNLFNRNQQLIRQGTQDATGGDPRVQQAQQQQTQLKSVIAQVQKDAPDNEDPIAAQSRLTTAIMGANINPQLTMQASQRLIQMQEAQMQRAKLGVELTGEQQTNAANLRKQQVESSKPWYYGKINDPDSIQMISAVDDKGDLRPVHDMSADLAQLNKTSPGGVLLDETARQQAMNYSSQMRFQTAQANNTRALQQTMLQGQTARDVEAMRAQASTDKASAGAGGLTGNSAMMSSRVLAAAEMASTDLKNVSEQSFGATTGIFGSHLGAKPGAGLLDSVKSNLAQAVNSDDIQRYNTMTQGMWRSIGMLETQGGIQGMQQFSQQVEQALGIRPTDTLGNMMTKLAQTRQVIEKATGIYMANPKIPQEQKDQVQEYLDSAAEAIPFTVSDVTKFQRAQEKDPGMSYHQWAVKNDIGLKRGVAGATKPLAGADAPETQTFQGKTYTLTPGSDRTQQANWTAQ